MSSDTDTFRASSLWARAGLLLGLLLLGNGVQAGRAQSQAPDSQQVRPPGVEQIRRRIEAIRQTPTQWRRRVAEGVPSRTRAMGEPARRAGRGERDGLTRTDLRRLERRLRAVVRRVLAEELAGGAPVEAGLPPDTVRVAEPVPADTVVRRLDRDSVRVVRDTLRELRVAQVERRLLDTGVFRAFEVNFAFGKSTLQPRATRTLDAVGTVLERYPALRIEITGHTDAVGTEAFNQRLSEARARAVRTYLIDRFGIGPERLLARGVGEARPVASNDERAGRALNRRVEFRVLNPEDAP